MKKALNSGANVNAKDYGGDTPLHKALAWKANDGDYEQANDGDFEIVKIIVQNGADINVANNDGNKPLNWVDKNIKLADFLIANGAEK